MIRLYLQYPHRDESYIDGVDLDEFGENPEWSLEKVQTRRNEVLSNCVISTNAFHMCSLIIAVLGQ